MDISELMIPVSVSKCQSKSWKNELKSALSNVDELLEYVGLDNSQLKHSVIKNSDFPIRVPRCYADKIEKGNRSDPLLLQVLPRGEEEIESDNFVKDPLGEQNGQTKSLIHKYHGRVLLMLSGTCAVNCRYCFRRHFPYSEHRFDSKAQDEALRYIQRDSSITEVILSGGDPLMLQDNLIDSLLTRLEQIPHLKRLRIHTRLPVMIPSRLTLSLAQRLSGSRLLVSIVLHINHANEFDKQLAERLKIYSTLGITLLNQSVLLKDVNDSAARLVDLSEKLYEIGVLPYYLHLLDPVKGAIHFNVEKEHAIELIEQVTSLLPGYLVPKLVQEIADKPSKIAIY